MLENNKKSETSFHADEQCSSLQSTIYQQKSRFFLYNKKRSFTQASIIKIISTILTLCLLYIFFIKSANTLIIPATSILVIISLLIILVVMLILSKEPSIRKNITSSTLIFIIISFILYTFPNKIFSIFIHETGLLNFTIYEFKIIFFAFPLLGFKIFIEKNFYKNINELTIFHIIYLFKNFIILLIVLPILYTLYSLSGAIWSIPIYIIISTFIDIIIYAKNLAH